MKAIEKVKIWLKVTGITGIAYGGAALVAWFFGIGWLGWMCLGALIYANANIIWKLLTDTYKKI